MFRSQCNPFLEISKKTHIKPGAIEEIVIKKHMINEIKPNDLRFFINLQYLFIPYNNLTKLNNLESNIRLKFIDARHNKISDFDLSKQLFLEELYLSGNCLQNLSATLKKMEHIKRLHILDLKDNLVSLEKGYRKQVANVFPDLEILDGQHVTPDERKKILTQKSSKTSNLLSTVSPITPRRRPKSILQCLKERPLSQADDIVRRKANHIIAQREERKEKELLEQTAAFRKQKEEFEMAAQIRVAPIPQELDFLEMAKRKTEQKVKIQETSRPNTRLYFKSPSFPKNTLQIGERLFKEL